MIGTAFSALASQEMTDAIANVKALATTTSKMSIGSRIEPAGFTRHQIQGTLASGGIANERIEELVGLWLDNEAFRAIDASIRRTIAHNIRVMLMSDPDVEARVQHVDFNFVVGDGRMIVFQMCFKPNPHHPGRSLYQYALIRTQFTPAAPYVVITHSKSNFFGSKEWSDIVYLPATITNAHIDTITHSAIAMIALGNMGSPLNVPLLTAQPTGIPPLGSVQQNGTPMIAGCAMP